MTDLINTKERIKIFLAIASREEDFTARDIQAQLKQEGSECRINIIQMLLRALCYRGYLQQYDVKLSPTRGRSTIHFRRLQNLRGML